MAFQAIGRLIEDMIANRATDLSVATVGARDIDPSEFEYELSREVQRLRQTLGGQLTEEQLVGLGVGNSVLQRMINDVALSEKSPIDGYSGSGRSGDARYSYRSGVSGLRRQIQPQLRFPRADAGHVAIPEQVCIERVRSDIALRQMLGPVTSAAASPKKLGNDPRLPLWRNGTAQETLLTTRPPTSRNRVSPAMMQSRSVYEAQAAQFTAPEYRKIRLVHLDPLQFAGWHPR